MSMTSANIYEDIATRTGGDIYLGVVGPVRTGKSTFIKRFMETVVMPGMDDVFMLERTRDELPQSGSGRTIMTAEPKFVPEEAISIQLESGVEASVRLIDCVGYMVKGAMGQFEGETERMVTTPWFDHEISMTEAAETGTSKVISDHSTIGIVVTTDGSICGIAREDYVEPEERVISELQAIGKPFILLLNCAYPGSREAMELSDELSEKYDVTCMPINCMEMGEEEILDILRSVLYEFPISSMAVYLPSWIDALPDSHAIKSDLYDALRRSSSGMLRIRDVYGVMEMLRVSESVESVELGEMLLGTGTTSVNIEAPRSLYYQTITEQSGFEINGDGDLMRLLTEMAEIKSEYDRVSSALSDVKEKGYGIVMPAAEELRLEEPEIVRHGGRYSVRLKASAPSIHMIRANIQTEVSPALGAGDGSSDEIISFLLQGFEGDTAKLWESNIFGKSLYDIAGEGLTTKIKRMPEDAQVKLQDTLQRIINEGSGGLICIIL